MQQIKCIKTVKMSITKEIAFKKGKIYGMNDFGNANCEDGCASHHVIPMSIWFDTHFKLIKSGAKSSAIHRPTAPGQNDKSGEVDL